MVTAAATQEKMGFIVFKNRFPVYSVNHGIKKLKMDGSAIYYLGEVGRPLKNQRPRYCLVAPSGHNVELISSATGNLGS